VAGTFYPRQAEALRTEVVKLLLQVKPALAPRPKALIVPHAGYVYSGPIAATAYAELQGTLTAPEPSPLPAIERVVLMGPAHRVYVSGVAAAGAARFSTPLGAVEVDLDWLARWKDLEVSPRAHAPEHCLEVQLPFLQRLLPQARIVPLLCSDAPSDVVGRVLTELWGGAETLIVISSDLSHYLPYATARAVDEETARRILALDDRIDGEHACGCAAINGLLHVAQNKGLRGRLLDLRNSGDTAGSRDEVVGYAAFAFYEERPCPS
jgi:AmmeMemoRadiSam system protein B